MVLFFHPSTFWTKLLIFLRVVPDLLGTRSLVLEHVVHARPITFTRMTCEFSNAIYSHGSPIVLFYIGLFSMSKCYQLLVSLPKQLKSVVRSTSVQDIANVPTQLNTEL